MSTIKADSFHTSDGARLNRLRAGPETVADSSKTLVLLIPGWCMPAAIWRVTLLALAPEFDVVALDPRGQGDSELVGRGYHIDRRADDIGQCIDQCVDNGVQVILVGWSLGALEALHYVRRQGERNIKGLVLVDSSVGEEPAIPPAQSFRDALRADRRGTVEQFVRAMFRTARPQSEIDLLIESALRLPLEDSLALFPSHIPRDYWRGIVRTVQAPLLYVVTPQFAEQAANLKLARPATQVEIFSEAGHALFVDEAGRFNRLLAQFIGQIDRDRRDVAPG